MPLKNLSRVARLCVALILATLVVGALIPANVIEVRAEENVSSTTSQPQTELTTGQGPQEDTQSPEPAEESVSSPAPRLQPDEGEVAPAPPKQPGDIEETLVPAPTFRARGFAARAASPGTFTDPRFECGAKIGLLFDASRSTQSNQPEMTAAVKKIISALAGTGSSLGIHTFSDASPSSPSLPNFGPVLLDGAGVSRANDYASRLNQAWDELNLKSNIAAGFKSFQGQGYDAVILVSDGQPYYADRANPTSTFGRTSQEDLANTSDAARQLASQGVGIFSVLVAPEDPYYIYNQQYTQQRDQPFFPDSAPIPAGVERSNDRSGWRIWFNGQFRTLTARDRVQGSPGQREVVRNGKAYPLYVTWTMVNSQQYLSSFSNFVTKIGSFTELGDALGDLTRGCFGVVEINKRIVDDKGAVLHTADAETAGFTFSADRALVEESVRTNVSKTTDGTGKVNFSYPVTSGPAAVTVTESASRPDYSLRPQQIQGKTVTATCTARNSSGQNLEVGYGSGTSIVVESDVENQRFTLRGMGREDRVICAVDNVLQKPEFSITKTKFGPGEDRVVGSQSGQILNAEYAVEVTNKSSVAARPERLLERPFIPRGMAIDQVVVVPDGSNSLVSGEKQFTRSGNDWVLPGDSVNEIPTKASLRGRVLVTYRLVDATQIQKGQLDCRSGDRNRGFFNEAVVAFDGGKTAASQACLSGSQPKLAVEKRIAGQDADSKEASAAIFEDQSGIPIAYEITNKGPAAIVSAKLSDRLLNTTSGVPAGAFPISGLQCSGGATVVPDGDGAIVTFSTPIPAGRAVQCSWNAPGAALQKVGDYHADEITTEASYALPSGQAPSDENSAAARVIARDQAWAIRIPTAVGVLPEAGGDGVWKTLLGGFVLASVGLAGLSIRRRN